MASTLDTYNKSQAAKDAQTYQNQSITDIANKYGFDFSRDYANQQAEVMAQAQRNAQESARRQNDSANKLNTQRIKDDYRGAASSLDKGYFQQFLGAGQSQANRGLNAGIAAGQNLQLAMNKQGELADIWRTRNQSNQEESMRFSNTNQNIADALAQIERERVAGAEKMYQDGLLRGYDVLSSDRNYGLQLDNNSWGKYMDGLNYELSKKQGSGGGGGSRSGGSSKSTQSTLSTKTYDTAKSSQAQSNLQKYYQAPVPYNQQYLYKEYGMTKPSVANNSNLTDWEKMKLIGG